MRKIICVMLLVAVILAGCQKGSNKSNTTAAPVHNVPPAVYPGPKSANSLDTSTAYPGPQGKAAANANSSSDIYPEPAASAESTPVVGTFTPLAGDEKLNRGDAIVDIKQSELILLETFPVQVRLHLKGTLPNPCYQLRVNPSQPDDQNRIQVEVYAVVEPDKMCTEVVQDFNVLVPLGPYSSGHYSIYINGELLGEFDA
jgi:hypothetical protein